MEPEKKSNGAFVGLAVIVIILVVGGIYIWRSNEKNKKMLQEQAEALSNQDAALLNALEEEAKGTDTNVGVDANSVN